MKYAIGPRKEMAVRTIFNILGPLTNPAGAPNQLLGVFADELVEPLAQVLNKLGCHHVLVVHSEDGMDEISIGAPTHVAELKNGKVETYTITPEQYGISKTDISALAVSGAEESLKLINAVLDNQPGAARDIVMFNAGAAIYAANLVDSLEAGIKKADEVITSGAAKAKLAALVKISNSF